MMIEIFMDCGGQGYYRPACEGVGTTGVMKAHWNWRDYGEMSIRPLPFEPIDVEPIHLGLKTRAARPSHGVAGGE
jgi:hypothetical protein